MLRKVTSLRTCSLSNQKADLTVDVALRLGSPGCFVLVTEYEELGISWDRIWEDQGRIMTFILKMGEHKSCYL